MHLTHNYRQVTSFHRKLQSHHFYKTVVGLLWLCSIITSSAEDHNGLRIARKISSPLEPAANGQIPTEELHHLLSLLEGNQKEIPSESPQNNEGSTHQRASSANQKPTAIHPELIRTHPPAQTTVVTSTSPSTTTESSPISRVTARRAYRRLRRKTTTTPTPSAAHRSAVIGESRGMGRMLPTSGGPGDLLQQLSLLNGILGALNSTEATASVSSAQQPINAPITTVTATNDNTHANNATSVPDILAMLTGAKADASSKSEVVLPPPPSAQSSPNQVDDQTKSALALLNLFSGSNSNNDNNKGTNGGNVPTNFLNLVSQTQSQPASPQTIPESDAAATLTKLLLQSSVPSTQTLQGNSILQPVQTQQADASANQLTNLLGILGTLGAAAGGGLQPQSNAGSINNLFNLGGDQQTAQAQNSLANLFGGNQQQQQQGQNLLNILGGNQGGLGAAQGFSLANLLSPQAGGNSIPGLGLLSTMSSLGSSIFSTMSTIFGGSRQDGKPRVRGKGVDTRLGLGYRLGNVGDAQIVWDIGPQLFTDPLRNEVRGGQNAKKRESGPPSPLYLEPASILSEKEVQQHEAKRRMVHSAIKDHYKNDHYYNYNQFSSLSHPTYRRSQRDYDTHTTSYQSYKPYEYPSLSSTTTPSPSSAVPSIFSSLPLVDHIRGFWSGLTSGLHQNDEKSVNVDNEQSPSVAPTSYFDDIRSEFSANLIKRSSPYFEDYEPNARRRSDDYVTEKREPSQTSTLTDYEQMLLKYGKDIGIGGVANTKHGVVQAEKPAESESNIFSKWFKAPSFFSSLSLRNKEEEENNHQEDDWRHRSMATSSSNEYPVISRNHPAKTNQNLDMSRQQFSQDDVSFNRRNEGRPSAYPQRGMSNKNGNRRQSQPRRSHNPFRNWFKALKSATSGASAGNHRYHQRDQRPRSSQHSQFSGGFGRRHFKRPSANPKLQHFTNMNKDLMMADANIADDFVETAGEESIPGAYDQPMTYNYASEFPDVPLTMPPKRLRPSQIAYGSSSSISQSEKIVEPALLYDHLETKPQTNPETEATEMDESFSNRNKVVVNSKLKEIEKQKILKPFRPESKIPPTLSKLQVQRLRLTQLRANSTGSNRGKQNIVVKIKGSNNHYKTNAAALATLKEGGNKREEDSIVDSSTPIPSVLSTISSIFSGTSKPKLLNNLIHNATSFLPSIGAIRILPRKKKKKDQKTRLAVQNGKPTIVAPPEDDLEADGDEIAPVVQVGHDMSFTDLQSIFGASKNNNSTKRRFRIRVKESVLKGEEKEDDKERKDHDEDEEDEETRDIFVDIESGEVSVLKPVASLVSFVPKKEETSKEVEVDYYEDDDGDGVADHDMKRKEHIFDAIQKELVRNFEKMKKAQLRAEAKKKRKEELAQKGMDESMDHVTKLFDIHQTDNENAQGKGGRHETLLHAGGILL